MNEGFVGITNLNLESCSVLLLRTVSTDKKSSPTTTSDKREQLYFKVLDVNMT